jgi:methionyl-tRNA formyltransferase
VPQDEADATYAPRIAREDGRVDWTRPARQIHDQVRGLHPWPHAFTFLDGERLLLLRTQVEGAGEAGGAGRAGGAGGGGAPGTDVPGTVVDASRDRLVVACGAGSRLRLEVVQREGRKPLAAREFLAGVPIAPGARFSDAP